MAIDLWRMRLLDTFARLGTVRATAHQMLLSPSTVTHHLGRLEAEAGVSLFERTGRRLTLTPTGALLVERARALQNLVESIESELAEIASGPAGRVRIGGFSSSVKSLLIPAALSLRESYPLLSVELLEVEPRDAAPALFGGSCDIVVAVDEGDGELLGSSIAVTRLTQDPLMVVLPKEHPLSKSSDLRLEELAGERWALDVPGSYLGELVPHRCRLAGFEPVVAGRFGSYQALLSHVGAGLAVGILPALAIREFPGVVCRASDLEDRRIVATTRKGVAGTAAVRAALYHLSAAASALAP